MSENKRKNFKDILVTVILFVCCAGVGFLIGLLSVFEIPDDVGIFEFIVKYLFKILLMFLALYLQIIIHEAGHLLAGLLTGYRFSSFRIGSLMLLKTSKGFSMKSFSLAGTGGQCLMIPPDKNSDGTYPYKLYHLGGVLLNLISGGLSFALFFLTSAENPVHMFFLYIAVFGVIIALMNGIPIRSGGVATDGYNVIHIGAEPFALEAMWLQLKINEAQTEGTRLKDLPEEWFVIPENAAKNNEIISTIEVFAENRAMDELDFNKAKEIIDLLEEGRGYSVIGLYKNLLLLDKITIDLIENGADADVSGLDDKKFKTFMKAMEKFPSVIRTEYAVQLIKCKDPEAARKYKDLFNSVIAKYPSKSDIESEMEIMNYIDTCANKDGLTR